MNNQIGKRLGLAQMAFFGLTALCLTALPLAAQSPTMIRLASQSKNASLEEFLKHFDYAAYLKEVEFTDFDSLQRDRLFVWRAFGEGDAFLYHLGQHFIKHYPVGADLPRLSAKTAIGLAFLNARGNGVSPQNRAAYEIVGYYVLGQVSSKMSSEIAADRLDPSDPDTAALMKVLADNKVHVAFERNAVSKLVEYAKNGQWVYIAKRGGQKLQDLVSPKGKGKGAPSQDGGFTGAPSIQLKPFRSFHPVRGGEVSMNAFAARERKSGEALGHVIFLHRPSAKARYFASNVSQRLNGTNRVLVAMTGGFTNNYRKPEGLTIDRGQVINAVLMHDRDALVMVEAGGGIRVINLKRSTITLPGVGQIANPRENLVAFSRLIQWCQQNRATTFQTQLLAFGDEILIDPSRASGKLAERRLLALVSHQKTGEVRHIIFNMRKPHSLFDLTRKAFHVLKVRDLKIEALLNLDTGGQDVIELYDERRRVVSEVEGRLGPGQTTNLLVYQR